MKYYNVYFIFEWNNNERSSLYVWKINKIDEKFDSDK